MEEEGQTDTYGRTFKALTGFLPLSQHGKTTEAHTRTPSLLHAPKIGSTRARRVLARGSAAAPPGLSDWERNHGQTSQSETER